MASRAKIGVPQQPAANGRGSTVGIAPLEFYGRDPLGNACRGVPACHPGSPEQDTLGRTLPEALLGAGKNAAADVFAEPQHRVGEHCPGVGVGLGVMRHAAG
jgi:hypothetical protein